MHHLELPEHLVLNTGWVSHPEIKWLERFYFNGDINEIHMNDDNIYTMFMYPEQNSKPFRDVEQLVPAIGTNTWHGVLSILRNEEDRILIFPRQRGREVYFTAFTNSMSFWVYFFLKYR